MFRSAKAIGNKAREIDRGLGQRVEGISRFLWPWRERWLWLVVGLLAILDFTGTYILLDLSGKNNVYESGRVAIWALKIGGFPFLLLVDLIAAIVLSLAAFLARYLYNKHGFKGYGRAAFIFILAPYIIVTAVAIVNNFVLLFI
jgi:hypothetical protein